MIEYDENYGDVDLDDPEQLQFEFEDAGPEYVDGGDLDNIMSGALNNSPRIDMYRSWVYPDLYPDEQEARIDNWSEDDIEYYT